MRRKQPAETPPPKRVLEEWTERDLGEAAAGGHLLPAFDVEDAVQAVGDALLEA
jgi:hypothetical protein